MRMPDPAALQAITRGQAGVRPGLPCDPGLAQQLWAEHGWGLKAAPAAIILMVILLASILFG